MFTSRYVKHSKLLVRHAEKYLRYKRDLLSDEKREELRTSVKSLATALREKKADRIAQDRFLCRSSDVIDHKSPGVDGGTSGVAAPMPENPSAGNVNHTGQQAFVRRTRLSFSG